MICPDLKEKVAVVTGAGRGIGRAISLALARCGAGVVLAARHKEELEEVRRQITHDGGRALVVPTDVQVEEQIVVLFARVRQTFGQLDVLINNAGVGFFGPTVEFSSDSFDRVMNTNLRGAFLCCREALKIMLPQGRGYIINIASVVGFKGYPRQAAYTASKHGVMGLTRSLAAEVQDKGIRVSAVLPGGVDTAMAGQARPDLDRQSLLNPEDVAQSVLYLLSLSERAAVDEIYIRRRSASPF